MAPTKLTPNCPDCAIDINEPHHPGCDVARCLTTGLQRLSCDLEVDSMSPRPGTLLVARHDCGADIWTGRRPGEAECEEFNWWVQWGPDVGRQGGWIRCERSDQGARHDLNRLVVEAVWDPAGKRWHERGAPSSPRPR